MRVGLLVCWALLASPVGAEPKESCEAVRKTARFSVHFERVELAKLVQTVSDATCKAFIVGDNVKGAISLVGPENGTVSLDAEQFYAAFLAALDGNGLAAYRQGRFMRIVEKARARQAVPLLLEGAPFPAPEEVVTRIFRLKSAELEPVRAVLSQLLMPGGDLLAAPPDLLIATDTVASLQRLEPLLAQLDVPRAAELIRLVPVRHADSADLADKITRLLAPKPGAKASDAFTVTSDERTNRLLVVAPQAQLDRILSLVEQLDVEVPGDGRARVYRLKNADAKEVAAALEGLTQGSRGKAAPGGSPGMVSGEARVTPNEALNALVIVASAGDYRSLVEVIEQLDAPVRQVFIETVIMEVNLQRDATTGVSFHGVAGTADTPVLFGSQPQGAISSLSLEGLSLGSGLLAGIQGPVLTQVSKVLGFDIAQFGVVLQALQLSSDVNVLSTPHIVATDNREAEISVGQRIPFQSGANPAAVQSLLTSGNSATANAVSAFGNVTREKVELKLTVKPHIGEGDNIRLEINQSAEEVAGENKLGPITSTRSQKTQVVARDEETVVLGGIMQDREIESVSKTPFLGDIPLLGALFRWSSKKKTKVNLLVFLTPHIIRDASDFRRVLDRKMSERRKIMEQFYGDTPEYEAAIDFARKSGPLAKMAQALARERARPENGGEGNPGDAVIAPSAR